MTQTLALANAFDAFIKGCKTDGTWGAIKASCILAGWNNPDGALTPLVGAAPSSYYFTGTDTDANYSSTSLLLKFPGVNGSTSFVDESFIRVSATLSGAATSVSTAQTKFLPTSGFFSGGTGYILLGSNAALSMGTSDFTIESWVYKTTGPIAGITSATSYNGAASVRVSEASITLDSQGVSQITFSGATLPLNTWYHIAVTRSSGSARVFINGVQYGTTQTYTVNFSGQINAIGRLVADSTGSFTGYLSDLRITKGVARYTSAFTPPTRPFGTSTTADYNRETGLMGDGSTKYLDSGRAGNADLQNNGHLSVYVSTASPTGLRCYAACQTSSVSFEGQNGIFNATASSYPFRSRLSAFDANHEGARSTSTATGLIAWSRSASNSFTARDTQSNQTISATSSTSTTRSYYVFARNTEGAANAYADGRLAFYSIGESLDLALLDTRVTTLVNAIAAAVP